MSNNFNVRMFNTIVRLHEMPRSTTDYFSAKTRVTMAHSETELAAAVSAQKIRAKVGHVVRALE